MLYKEHWNWYKMDSLWLMTQNTQIHTSFKYQSIFYQKALGHLTTDDGIQKIKLADWKKSVLLVYEQVDKIICWDYEWIGFYKVDQKLFYSISIWWNCTLL
jgi:hypothetical protein